MMGKGNLSSAGLFTDFCKTPIPCKPSRLLKTCFFPVGNSLYILMKHLADNSFSFTESSDKGLVIICLLPPQLMMYMNRLQRNSP